MSRRQKYALVILEAADAGAYGVVTTGPTAMIDGQPWIHWRTAKALERRGFVRIDGLGEEAEVRFA